jgi:hypothetical protein
VYLSISLFSVSLSPSLFFSLALLYLSLSIFHRLSLSLTLNQLSTALSFAMPLSSIIQLRGSSITHVYTCSDMRAHACARSHTHIHARTHAHTHAQTQPRVCGVCQAIPAVVIQAILAHDCQVGVRPSEAVRVTSWSSIVIRRHATDSQHDIVTDSESPVDPARYDQLQRSAQCTRIIAAARADLD